MTPTSPAGRDDPADPGAHLGPAGASAQESAVALMDLPLFRDPTTEPDSDRPPTPSPRRVLDHPGPRPPSTPLAEPSTSAVTTEAAPLPTGRGSDHDIDWIQVNAFRGRAATSLSERLPDHLGLDRAGQQELGRRIILDLLTEDAEDALTAGRATYSSAQQTRMAAAIFDALFGLGRLQPLVDDADIENIEIYGCDHVTLEYADGRREPGPPVAESDEELVEFLSFLASRSQSNVRAFSEANPELHMRLDGGARLAANAWITPRPVVVIRRHRLRIVTLTDLVDRGMLDPGMASLLAAAVKAKLSIVVSGPQGSGKTTMVRALVAETDVSEKIGTVETEYELHLNELPERHGNVVSWEARPGSGERSADGRAAGEVTLDQILYGSFRFNLSRVIVGEVRGREVLAMFKAMQSGAGSMSTTHATSGRAAIERLVTCAMEAGPHVTEQFAYRQIAAHIDLIVQIALENTPRGGVAHRDRYVTEVLAVQTGGEHGYPAVTDVYTPGPDGHGVPHVLPDHLRALAGHGFDLTGFTGAVS